MLEYATSFFFIALWTEPMAIPNNLFDYG